MRRLVIDGPLEENCYFIVRDGLCYIVDPGYQKERIQRYVKDNNLEVLGILLTHGHFDHFGAVDCFNVPVYVTQADKESFILNYNVVYDKYKIHVDFKLGDINFKYIKDGDIIKLGNHNITVMETPGHTSGGVCYRIDDEIYSGDTLFRETVGRWDMKTGDKEALKVSIKKLMHDIEENVVVFPGHGEPTTIGHEKQINPFYIYECKETT